MGVLAESVSGSQQQFVAENVGKSCPESERSVCANDGQNHTTRGKRSKAVSSTKAPELDRESKREIGRRRAGRLLRAGVELAMQGDVDGTVACLKEAAEVLAVNPSMLRSVGVGEGE